MDIYRKIAVITGAASGIGEAVARELAGLGVKAMALVDRSQAVDETANAVTRIPANGLKCEPFVGDVTEEGFCHEVYDQMVAKYGVPAICVPAAGITRDGLAAKLDKATGKVTAYPREEFRLVTEVNLIAPVYWGLEMVCRIAQDRYQRGLKRWEAAERVQGTVIFIGSISSARQQGTDRLCRDQGRTRGGGGNAHAGGHVSRSALWRDPSRVYRHPNGQGAKGAVYQRTCLAQYAVTPVDPPRGDRSRHRFHGRQLGG